MANSNTVSSANGQNSNTVANVDQNGGKTDYTVNETVRTTEHHNGDTVAFTTDTDRDVTGTLDPDVYRLVNGLVESKVNNLMVEREQRENVRANHRNLNRMLTLFGALVIGLILTFLFQHQGIPGLVRLPHWMVSLAPYTFVITIAMDSGLALYGLIRHY